MLIKRTKIQNDIYVIAGKFYGKIHDHIVGKGEADYTLEGKIEGDFLRQVSPVIPKWLKAPPMLVEASTEQFLNPRVRAHGVHYMHWDLQPGNTR